MSAGLSGGFGPQMLHRGRCLTTEEAELMQTGVRQEGPVLLQQLSEAKSKQKQPPQAGLEDTFSCQLHISTR